MCGCYGKTFCVNVYLGIGKDVVANVIAERVEDMQDLIGAQEAYETLQVELGCFCKLHNLKIPHGTIRQI